MYHNVAPFSLFQVKAIMAGLPQDEDGRIKIDDFIKKDIHSSEAFQVSSCSELQKEGRMIIYPPSPKPSTSTSYSAAAS